jgi:hypothetical protein
MEIGEKVLLISAGKDMPWAKAVCPELTRMEKISAAIRNGLIDFCIFYPLDVEWLMLTNETDAMRSVSPFAHHCPFPVNRKATKLGCGSMHPQSV